MNQFLLQIIGTHLILQQKMGTSTSLGSICDPCQEDIRAPVPSLSCVHTALGHLRATSKGATEQLRKGKFIYPWATEQLVPAQESFKITLRINEIISLIKWDISHFTSHVFSSRQRERSLADTDYFSIRTAWASRLDPWKYQGSYETWSQHYTNSHHSYFIATECNRECKHWTGCTRNGCEPSCTFQMALAHNRPRAQPWPSLQLLMLRA